MSKKVATVIFHEDEDEDEGFDRPILHLLTTTKHICREYLDTLTDGAIDEENVDAVLGSIMMAYPMETIAFFEKAGLLTEDDEDDEEDEE